MKEIKEEQKTKNKKRDINNQALRYLEYRPRTTFEMRKHLEEKDYSEEEIIKCIEFLKEVSYIDDVKYAMDFIRISMDKARGRYRIERELIKKGINTDDIRLAYEKFQEYVDKDLVYIEEEKAREQARKIAQGKKIDEKLLAKMGRRLASLGYRHDLIYRIMNEYKKGTDVGEEF